MSNPPTEIRRGWGWETDQWQRFEPHFWGMVDIAQDGMEHFGVSYSKGIILTIQRAGSRRKPKYSGSSLGNKNHITVCVPAAASYPSPMQYALWSGVMFHEDVHSARAETIPYYGEITEGIATEGLAYGLEQSQVIRTGSQGAKDYIASLNFLPSPDVLGRFYDLRNKTGMSHSHAWLNKHVGGIPVMAQLGVHFIRERQAEGATIPELVSMSAEEVVGL